MLKAAKLSGHRKNTTFERRKKSSHTFSCVTLNTGLLFRTRSIPFSLLLIDF